MEGLDFMVGRLSEGGYFFHRGGSSGFSLSSWRGGP